MDEKDLELDEKILDEANNRLDDILLKRHLK